VQWLVGVVAAGAVSFAGLAYLGVQVARRNDVDQPGVRGTAAAVAMLLVLFASGIVVFVLVGTSIDRDTDTYTGRQVLYLELALTGSYLIIAACAWGAYRLVSRRVGRRPLDR
jgi:hypothetical protein